MAAARFGKSRLPLPPLPPPPVPIRPPIPVLRTVFMADIDKLSKIKMSNMFEIMGFILQLNERGVSTPNVFPYQYPNENKEAINLIKHIPSWFRDSALLDRFYMEVLQYKFYYDNVLKALNVIKASEFPQLSLEN